MGRALLAVLCLAFALPLHSADTAGTATEQPSTPPAHATAVNGTPKANEATRSQPGQVTQAVFTTGINGLEPVNNISSLTSRHRQIYFFTDLRHMTGQTITHRWVYKGKVMAQVKFHVGGPRWRVYSLKTLDPAWLGEWEASVVDASGVTLGVSTFEYVAATKRPVAKPGQNTAAPAALPSSH
ncbi:MAG: DUF2914 domain-containing protein [Acidiferrobacterales bacterium]